jgi:hypothetical protein
MYITSDRYWPILAALAIIPDGSFGAVAAVKMDLDNARLVPFIARDASFK